MGDESPDKNLAKFSINPKVLPDATNSSVEGEVKDWASICL